MNINEVIKNLYNNSSNNLISKNAYVFPGHDRIQVNDLFDQVVNKKSFDKDIIYYRDDELDVFY